MASTKRKTIEQIREYVEKSNDGYILISNTYVNCIEKLIFKCPKGHIFDINWNNYNNGQRCRYCAGVNKKTIEEINKHIKQLNNGYVLLSTEYKGAHAKLDFMCPEKHMFKMSWNEFLKGYRCKYCSKKVKKTIEEINRYAETFDYILLSFTYINNHTKLDFKCPCGHDFKMPWNDFLTGYRCPDCHPQYSKGELKWLATLGLTKNTKRFGHYLPDGFDPETNTIYEYHGDKFHGNPKLYDKDDIFPKTHQTYGFHFEQTLKKYNYCKQNNLQYKCVWASDFEKEEDYSFFPFPSVSPQYEGAVTSGADLLVMFNDNEASHSLVEYLATAEAQEIWVQRGGFTSTNKLVSLESYPDVLAAKVAEQLTSADIVRFDADDIWGGDLQAAFYQGVLNYLADPSRLDRILEHIEAEAAEQLE